MTRTIPRHPPSLTGLWIVWFPITYLAHIAEEYQGNFPAAVAALTGLNVPMHAFLAVNAALWILMSVVVAVTLGRPSRQMLVVALGAIVLINTATHVTGSWLMGGYSPGTITAVLMWLPLGTIAVVRGRRVLTPSRFYGAIAVGAVVHAMLPLILLAAARA